MPIETSDPIFKRLADGSVKTIFKNPETSSSATPPIFQSLPITPIAFEDDILVSSFEANG